MMNNSYVPGVRVALAVKLDPIFNIMGNPDEVL